MCLCVFILLDSLYWFLCVRKAAWWNLMLYPAWALGWRSDMCDCLGSLLCVGGPSSWRYAKTCQGSVERIRWRLPGNGTLRQQLFKLEMEMASHSSILAWRIPWTEEPGRLQSVGSRRDGHDWVTQSPSLLQGKTGSFCCCLCAMPLGCSLWRIIFLFVAVLWNLWKMPCWLPEPGNQGVPPGWQPQKPRCHVCAPAPFQEIAVGVQSLSRVQLFETPWTATRQASLSFTTSWSLLKLKSIESVMPSSYLILCRPLLLPSVFISIRVFSYELALHFRWPKYWSFSISSSNEYSVLISLRIDWFDLLAVQGILKSLLPHPSSKALILRLLAFFMVPTLTSVRDY